MSYTSSSFNESSDIVSTSLPVGFKIPPMPADEIDRRRPSMCPTLSEDRDWREVDRQESGEINPTMIRNQSSDSVEIIEKSRLPDVDVFKKLASKPSTAETSKHESTISEHKKSNSNWFGVMQNLMKDKGGKEEKKSMDDIVKAVNTPTLSRRLDKRYAFASVGNVDSSLRGSFGTIFSKNAPKSAGERRKEDDIPDPYTQTQISVSDSVDEMSIHPDAFRMFSHNILSSSTVTRPIQVNIRWRASTQSVKILPGRTVGDCITVILQEIKTEITKESTPTNDLLEDPASFLLGKVDRNSPWLHTWMNSSTPVSDYSIVQGDQLLLKHVSDIEKVNVSIPPQIIRVPFQYAFDTLVSEAINKLRQEPQSERKERYGLYCPKFGMWLDETKTLFSYNLVEDTTLELRALANEFLLRIYLCDFDQKIAIKALPSLQVSDILAMIQHQLENRKLYISKTSDYGLIVISTNQWLQLDQPIDKYAEAKTEALHFRIQYHYLNIITPTDEVRISVDERATIKDVLERLKSTNSSPEASNFALHFPTGERLKESDLAWNTLKEISIIDRLRYRPASRKLFLCVKNDPTLAVEVEVDFSCKLEILVPYFCRRLGIRYSEFCGIFVGETQKLDLNTSLIESNVLAGSKVIIEWQTISSTNEPQPDENVSIWDEPNNAETIQLSGGEGPSVKIVSATLNKLVEKLTEDKDQGTTIYLDFVKTFLLTYQSFTTSANLLKKISDRYAVPNTKQLSWSEFDKFRTTIQLRVCNVILQWSKKYTWDFTHPVHGRAICDSLLDFVDNTLAFEHTLMARQIRKNIFKVRDGLTVMSSTHMLESWRSTTGARPDTNAIAFGYNAEDISMQLTMIEEYFFSAITPSEMLGQAWTKKDANKRAPGILALTRRFNAVACWVGWSILECKTPKLRAERMTKLIEVANHLHSINNFSTLMAVIAGLNKASISRLKQTAKELNSKISKRLAELEKIMSAESSYKNYRASIRSVAPPCIPYIGTYLIDLTYMEDGNPDMIQGLINFGKRELISGVIREMVVYQQTRYNVKPIEELATVLSNIPEASEDVEKKMWIESKKLE